VTVRRHLLAVLALAGLALTGLPASAQSGHEPALAPGQPAHDRVNAFDGIKIFLRYQTPDSFYAVHANRRDGTLRIERKVGGGEGASAYDSLQEGFAPTYAPTYDHLQSLTASAVDRSDGSVRIRLYADGTLIHEAIDDGSTRGGAPLPAGHVGLRTDNLEFSLDRAEVHAADAAGDPTGTPLLRDTFDRPDGLITNQRIQSAPDHTWLVTSGSLFARDGRGWSGMPDRERPTPDSRWSTNSSTFRMITHRDDFRDVAVSLQIANHGYVGDPAVVAPTPPPTPSLYPSGTHDIAVDRRQGRSNEHVAISVSTRAFPNGADEAVLISTNAQPTSLLGPALAGAVRGPLLLSRAGSLHPDTAVELGRLGVSRVHLIGDLSGAVASDLRGRGYTVRQYTGTGPEDVAGKVARQVGGSHVYLAVTDRWNDAASMAGAAARERRPILLTPANRLHDLTADTIDGMDVRSITVIGTDLDARVVRDLRRDGIEVSFEGHSRYSIAAAAADRQVAAGAAAGTVWLAPGSRPFYTLAGAAAATTGGGVLLVVDGNDLGDLSYTTMAYDGLESKNWARYHRDVIRRLRPIGPADALTDRVVGQVRAPQRTVLAGVTDIAGNVHQDAIVWVLEAGVATGFTDDTYRPSGSVTRGQMATFLDRALDLPAGDADFTDIAGNTHAAAIARVAAADIAGGFPDGTFRPEQPVSRQQMATFLTRALELTPTTADFPDVDADGVHARNIGAVADADIAGGFPDGTYRPTADVTRGQMATFLQRGLQR
jgi:hypothetical protein